MLLEIPLYLVEGYVDVTGKCSAYHAVSEIGKRGKRIARAGRVVLGGESAKTSVGFWGKLQREGLPLRLTLFEDK